MKWSSPVASLEIIPEDQDSSPEAVDKPASELELSPIQASAGFTPYSRRRSSTPPSTAWSPCLSPMGRKIQQNERVRAQMLSSGGRPLMTLEAASRQRDAALATAEATEGSCGSLQACQGSSAVATAAQHGHSCGDQLMAVTSNMQLPEAGLEPTLADSFQAATGRSPITTPHRSTVDNKGSQETPETAELVEVPSAIKNPLYEESASSSTAGCAVKQTTDTERPQPTNGSAKSGVSFRSAIRRAAGRNGLGRQGAAKGGVPHKTPDLSVTESLGPSQAVINPKAVAQSERQPSESQSGDAGTFRMPPVARTPGQVSDSKAVASLWDSGRRATESLAHQLSTPKSSARSSIRCSLLDSMNSVSNEDR